MKKYGLIIVFLIASCAQEESEKVTVSFFDSNNGKIWYYGYTYEQFTNEDYIQFIKNNSSQGSIFLNVCEVIAGKSFSRKLNWGIISIFMKMDVKIITLSWFEVRKTNWYIDQPIMQAVSMTEHAPKWSYRTYPQIHN